MQFASSFFFSFAMEPSSTQAAASGLVELASSPIFETLMVDVPIVKFVDNLS
jgi:hypothetical protein